MVNKMNWSLVLNELKIGHEIPIIVRGNSMEPTYHDGDLLHIIQSSSYEVGEVIVFIFSGMQIVHRIIKKDGEYLFCKGDHAQGIQKIKNSDIIGKVSNSK